MSFLKQLLKPFVEFDEQKKTEQTKSKVDPLPAELSEGNPHHPLITTDDPLQPSENILPAKSISLSDTLPLKEHVQYFEKLIDKANTENPIFRGADFKEFIDAKLDIDDIADENLKYTTAFNILKSSGLTKEKLLSTGHEYLNLVGRDLNAFQAAHAQQYKKELQQKELDLKKDVEELQALAQRVNYLKNEINQKTQEINATKETLNRNKNSFLLAGEKKQHEIENELNKISTYFK